MSAITSAQDGPWSAGATWVLGVPPTTGDTAILAHAVTVDVNTSVGTSPNDATTPAITVVTNKSLIIADGVTLNCKGNILPGGNGCIFQLGDNCGITFDNGASGGSPVYCIVGGLICKLNINGTSAHGSFIQAIAGQLCSMDGTFWGTLAASYCTFRRMAGGNIHGFGAYTSSMAFDHCTFDACQEQAFSTNTTSCSFSMTDCVTINSDLSSGDILKLQYGGAPDAGVARNFLRNSLDGALTYNSLGFIVVNNYFGGGILTGTTSTWAQFRLNVSLWPVTDGQKLRASVQRNYWIVSGVTGNPHFINPFAVGADNIVSQNIFESHCPDDDIGDSILVGLGSSTGGLKIKGKNNITLLSSFTAATWSSGTVLTMIGVDADADVEMTRNTGNINQSGVVGKRGMLATSEGDDGTAGQVPVAKNNLAFGTTSSQGYLGERVQGTVKDVFTASGANNNWIFNGSAGNNQRGWQSKGSAGDMWTAGDAVAAGVDSTQGTTDPQFYDNARNVQSWSTARGFGASFAAGLAALSAVPSRGADLVQYIFEGYRPGNSACRSFATDGGCVGAANFYKTSRKFTVLTDFRSTLSKFGI